MCAREADDSRIDLIHCDSALSNQKQSQTFELTTDGRLMTSESGNCLIVTASYYVVSLKCSLTTDKYNVRPLF